MPAISGRSWSACTRTASSASAARSVRGSPHPIAASCSTSSRHSASDEPPFDPAPPKDYRGRWGGDLVGVTWVRPEVVIRAELADWSRDGMVRQSAFKGIEPGRDPTTVAREHAVATASAIRDAESEALPSEVDMPTTKSKPKSKLDVEARARRRSPPSPGRRPTPSSPPSTRSARKASGSSAATISS